MQEGQIYPLVDFSKSQRIIEIGCGVGAQTRILAQRNPHLKIVSVDTSKDQIAKANENLKSLVQSGQVTLLAIEPGPLPFDENSFDGAFVCWVLEHVPNPVTILKSAKKVLHGGSPLYCNEVLNNTLYVNPYSPSLIKYWFEFNDFQWSLGGDPFVGARLGNLLQEAQFTNIHTQVLTHHLDNRAPEERERFIDYWCDLMLSGSQALLDNGRLTQDLVKSVETEMNALKSYKDSVLFYSWVFAKGTS